MKSLYVDLDNNKLLGGPLTTLIASREVFYSGNTETINVDLIQRDSNSALLNYAPATGTTLSMVVGIPGTVISIPAMIRTTQAGITATATASLFSAVTATATVAKYSTVTATVTASLFGNITAQATAVVTRGTACTLSMTTVTVRTPSFQIGFVSRGSAATASISTASTTSQAIPVKSNLPQGPGDAFIEIVDVGTGLYGSPQVYYANPWNNGVTAAFETQNITSQCIFENGKLISIDSSFISSLVSFDNLDFVGPLPVGENPGNNVYTGNTTTVSASVIVVPDPNYVFSAGTVTVASAGTGFPDGVNIPFSIPSDEPDGLPCTGFMRAVNGSVVSVVSISSRGSRFTSSTTSGKTHGVVPSFKLSSISVTCAGAGYWDSAPSVVIDDLFYDSTVPGATFAAASAVTASDGSVSLLLSNAGYGYTTAPNIRIAAPRISDGLRTVTLTNTPTGYDDGLYSCTVSAPTAGTTAAVTMRVNSGVVSFSIINPGAGYVSTPLIACPAPNLGNSIQSITITCAGIGYTTAPTVTVFGAGSGAVGSAVLGANGSISSVRVVSVGTGYTGSVTVGFASPNNLGKVQSISIATSGTNYNTAPLVTFSGGGGSGAAATASVLNGGISTISITDAGSGYTTAPTVTIDASPSRTIFAGVLTVTTSFVSSILPSTAVTIQINAASTIGVSTLLQVQGTVAATL